MSTTTISINGTSDVVVTSEGDTVIVMYGFEKSICRSYEEAAAAIGYAIMHALACDGQLPESIAE